MSVITAKYIRLSSEDDDLGKSGKVESNSVTNQRNLLDAFISRTPELADTSVIEFCDDGWSGKNFERPAVQEMIAQARAGKIQCIVVKDLSRFGRDYLTVGNYISCVFPFLGVRFIAVNDGFDSIRPTDVDSLETSFKALLYDLYSRDLSRKVRSAKKFRAQRGDFLAPFAPYGYVKDPADKARLVIDPEAAETVRRVFHLAASGHSADQIAMALNRETVPTPMLYKRAAGCSRTRWPSIEENNFWTDTAVVKILRDERYFGKNIFGKRIRDRVGHTHTVKVSREDWIAVENTHEGIVTREEFDRAQTAMREFVEHGELKKRDWPLRGKVRCGVCGHAMSYKLGKQMYFYCYTSRYNDSFLRLFVEAPKVGLVVPFSGVAPQTVEVAVRFQHEAVILAAAPACDSAALPSPAVPAHGGQVFQHAQPQVVHHLGQLILELRRVQLLGASGPPGVPELLSSVSEVDPNVADGTQLLVPFRRQGIEKPRFRGGSGAEHMPYGSLGHGDLIF